MSQIYTKIFTLLICLTVVFVVLTSKVHMTDTDARYELLVAESILMHGTIKLDEYTKPPLCEEENPQFHYHLITKNKHCYYYFPIGTSLVSVPFVAIAHVFGLNMLDKKSDKTVQIYLAALTALLSIIYLIKLARLFLTPINAVLISAVFWFGTSFASTAGTALWSHNCATLFALLAIYFSIRFARYKEKKSWLFIAIFLFMAYLCRPTMSLLLPLLLFYLWQEDELTASKSTIFLATLLMLFMKFSIYEFRQLLPDYYAPGRLDGTYFFEALYGNLLSPARGLLIYSPFLVFVWLCFGKTSKKIWDLKKSWWLLGLAWPLLHLITVSKFPHWWGGWAFGARFMLDVLPGLFLLTLYVWPTSLNTIYNKIAVSLLIIASIFAIYVNTYQGLFNIYAGREWNAAPNVEFFPETVFDWKYPQFSHNKQKHKERIEEYRRTHRPTILQTQY